MQRMKYAYVCMSVRVCVCEQFPLAKDTEM